MFGLFVKVFKLKWKLKEFIEFDVFELKKNVFIWDFFLESK